MVNDLSLSISMLICMITFIHIQAHTRTYTHCCIYFCLVHKMLLACTINEK